MTPGNLRLPSTIRVREAYKEWRVGDESSLTVDEIDLRDRPSFTALPRSRKRDRFGPFNTEILTQKVPTACHRSPDRIQYGVGGSDLI